LPRCGKDPGADKLKFSVKLELEPREEAITCKLDETPTCCFDDSLGYMKKPRQELFQVSCRRGSVEIGG